MKSKNDVVPTVGHIFLVLERMRVNDDVVLARKAACELSGNLIRMERERDAAILAAKKNREAALRACDAENELRALLEHIEIATDIVRKRDGSRLAAIHPYLREMVRSALGGR